MPCLVRSVLGGFDRGLHDDCKGKLFNGKLYGGQGFHDTYKGKLFNGKLHDGKGFHDDDNGKLYDSADGQW